MSNLRLIATDIDGTLANNQGELAPETIAILQTLLQRGMPVTLVTGLNPWPVKQYLAKIGEGHHFSGLRAISLNGIFLLEGEELHEGCFTAPEVIREAIAVMLEAKHVPLVFGEDGITRFFPVPAGMATVETLIAARPYQPFEAVTSIEALFTVRPALVSMTGSAEEAAALYPRLEAAVGERAYVVYQPGIRISWVEVNHREARKDIALLALAAQLGITPEEILYFGDSLNDLPVFEAIPHAVAVENARPEIKARAWRIAASNDAAGVARFLVEFFGDAEA
ncbi:MAG: HAD hydrolase family protein [Anaerolineae bacterium]|nr:HAD hydrolase family protein [Anaerolineae bacterium]